MTAAWNLTYRWSNGQRPMADADIGRALRGWADEIGPAVRDHLKDRTPVYRPPSADPHPAPGGRMRDSETYTSDYSDTSVTLTYAAHTPYAQYVISGARPHEITAVAARMLHYYTETDEKFRRSVFHPGNKPNPFPQEVLDEMQDEIMSNLKSRIHAEISASS